MKKEISYTNFKTEERIIRTKEVLNKRQTGLTIVLENVHDPHNVSAVFRSCDAVGVLEVCLVYHSGQIFPELADRASASAKKWVDQRRFESVEECFSALRNDGKKIYTTHMTNNSGSLYELDLTQPVALVFGNEHTGVSDTAVNLADGNFLIPQVGMIQSLNISVACAVSLYEAFRQRLKAGLYQTPQLDSAKFNYALEDWLKR